MDINVRFDAVERTPEGHAVYRPGERVLGRLQITSDRDQRARGVQFWAGCQIHGSGTSEQIELVPEQFIHTGDLPANQPIFKEFEFTIPQGVPPSYNGRRVNFDWQVRVRVDVPIWRDKRTNFPFAVRPAVAGQAVEAAEDGTTAEEADGPPFLAG